MAQTIAYYRVSTAQQGRSGLGLDAQRYAVRQHLGRDPDFEFTEVESGKVNDRVELRRALAECRIRGATLIVAKLDRLSRDAAFILTLQNSSVKFVCADMPHANSATVGIMAVIAQEERQAISKRTKEALAAAKARGVKLGGYRANIDYALAGKRGGEVRRKLAMDYARDLQHHIDQARRSGIISLNGLANYLNDQSITTRQGKRWRPTQVKRVLDCSETVITP